MLIIQSWSADFTDVTLTECDVPVPVPEKNLGTDIGQIWLKCHEKLSLAIVKEVKRSDSL